MAIDTDARGMAGSVISGLKTPGAGYGDTVARALAQPSFRRVVATKNGFMGGGKTSNITVNATNGDGTTNRALHRTPPYAVADLQIGYCNSRLTPAETSGANNITIRAAVEISGVSYPLFFNGARSVTIEPGAEVISDPLGIEIQASTSFYTRTYISVPTGGTWALGRLSKNGLGEGWNGKDGADTTDSIGSPGFTGDTEIFGPSVILGRPSKINASAVLLITDSIGVGSGDISGGTSNGEFGFIERGITDGVAWTTYNRNGLALNNLLTAHWRGFANRVSACTHALCQLGINDLTSGGPAATTPTLATMQSRYLTIWTALANRGVKVVQTTITPRTTSTDSWATLGNQTIYNATQEAVRVALNDWIRAGAPIDPVTLTAVAVGTAGALLAGRDGHPLHDYIEVADICESSRNSGKWIVTGAANYATTDGLHPTTAVHILMKEAVQPSAFS